MSPATLNIDEATSFWRVARRLHSIYAELDTTYELGMPPCAELDDSFDHPEPEVMDRVRQWFEQMDNRIQVWQLRQLLQSTTVQNEENLRYLIVRHRERQHKTEADKEKLDFLLVQYFAHCAPHGITEQQVTLEEVGRVLEPVLGAVPETYPEWASGLDEKLQRLNGCNSLEDLQNSGALLEVRELKLAVGDQYFEPGLLVAFTRFNFRARRAFFKAMHLDLHAIREAVNQLEQMGFTTVDCREAGLTESESLDQVRHVVHQWKTPFRAPYSGGSSFLQLILLRHALQHTLAGAASGNPRPVAFVSTNPPVSSASQATPSPVVQDHDPVQLIFDASNAKKVEPVQAKDQTDALLMSYGDMAAPAIKEQHPSPAIPPVAIRDDAFNSPGESAAATISTGQTESAPAANSEEDDYLQRCVADIKEQLSSVPPKNTPSVSAITLAGCKLLIATWEAEAFIHSSNELAPYLQRTVAARTILHVCMDRYRKGEPTDLKIALDLARTQATEMEKQVAGAKESNNIDAAVNLAATTKRLMSLIEEGEKLAH